MFKNLKTKRAVGVMLLLCVLLLVGCGGKESNDNNNSVGGASSNSTQLSTSKGDGGSNNNYELIKASIYIDSSVSSSIEEPSAIYINDKRSAEMPGYVQNGYKSLDGTKVILLVQEKYGYNAKGTYTLYNQDGAVIAEEVTSARLSLNGEAIVYLANVNYDPDPFIPTTGDLILYSNGATTVVVEEIDFGSFSISPDGKAVTYTVWNPDAVNYDSYYYYAGVTDSLETGCIASGISNEAEYIYYTGEDRCMYILTRGGAAKKVSDGYLTSFASNKDFTEVIFSESTSDTLYLSKNGGERIALEGGRFERLITPYNTAHDDELGVVGVKTFADTFYTNGNSVYYINESYETRLVDRIVNSDQVFLADDGKTLTYYSVIPPEPEDTAVYFYGGLTAILQINGKDPNSEPATFAENIGQPRNIVATTDGKAVFYADYSEGLLFQKGKGDPKQVSGITYFAKDKYALFDGDKLFFADGDGVFVSDGGEGKAVNGITGDFSIDFVGATQHGIMLAGQEADGTTQVYYSTDGKSFKLVS